MRHVVVNPSRTVFAASMAISLCMFGCDSGRGDGGPTSVGVGTAGATAGEGTDSSDASTGDDPMGDKLDLGAEETTGSPDSGGDECAAVTATSDVQLSPADIIFVVDNSGSMQFEANSVQNNLNAFSSQIFLANVDARVVLLSAYLANDDEGICLAPPLGSGMCPSQDDNPPGYTHVDQSIDSNDALTRLIERWPDYSGVLRPNSVRHVIVVSDDNSDMSDSEFMAQWTALDPANAEFRFHGIVADSLPISGPCFLISAAVGTVYLNLINQTGGIFGNLCSQEFQPIFDELATQVIDGAALACEYAIPEPPEGEEFDPDKVNVEFDDGAGGTLPIGRVDSSADCANVTDGWYYDNPANPTQILVCNQTCNKIQGFTTATISIKFGCETVPAG
jgi:hypothetical protein